MRVLMVTTSFPRHEGDHAGHFIATLAERVVALGHEVTVLAPHEGAVPGRETVRGVRVERFRYLPGWAEQVAYGSGIVINLKRRPFATAGLLPFTLALRRSVRRLAPASDIIHVHWGPTAALAAPWRSGKPYVLTLHGSDVTLARRGGLWLGALRRALRDAAGVDVVADEQRRFLAEQGLWDAARPIEVIPAGVPEDLIARPRAVRAEGTEGAFGFLYAGRLVESKGVTDLLGAFAEVRAAGIDAELELIGGGPLEDSLRERASTGPLAGRVRFRGAIPHDEALDAIARADALVLASYGEGSPLVVAEALALGTPVIGSRVGALPELLGHDGLVSDPGDVQALAADMERLARDPDLWQRLSAEGRARAAERLAWDTIARETVGFYRTALRLGHAEPAAP